MLIESSILLQILTTSQERSLNNQETNTMGSTMILSTKRIVQEKPVSLISMSGKELIMAQEASSDLLVTSLLGDGLTMSGE